MTFKIGDIVLDNSGNYVGIVCDTDMEHEGRQVWEVHWHDGDITHYEDGKSMAHHKIMPHQWSSKLYKKYLDIICP